MWRGIDNRSRVSNLCITKTAVQIASYHLVCVLNPLESIIRPEWEGQFPVAGINWFEVYTACTEVLEKICAAHWDDPKDLTSTHIHSSRNASFECG